MAKRGKVISDALRGLLEGYVGYKQWDREKKNDEMNTLIKYMIAQQEMSPNSLTNLLKAANIKNAMAPAYGEKEAMGDYGKGIIRDPKPGETPDFFITNSTGKSIPFKRASQDELIEFKQKTKAYDPVVMALMGAFGGNSSNKQTQNAGSNTNEKDENPLQNFLNAESRISKR